MIVTFTICCLNLSNDMASRQQAKTKRESQVDELMLTFLTLDHLCISSIYDAFGWKMRKRE